MSQSRKTDNYTRKQRSHSNNSKPDGTEPAEKKNRRQTAKDDYFEVKCDVCNLEFTSDQCAIEHFKGKKHAKRISVQVASEQRSQNIKSATSPITSGSVHDNVQHGNKLQRDLHSHHSTAEKNPSIHNDRFNTTRTTMKTTTTGIDINNINSKNKQTDTVNLDKANNMQPDKSNEYVSAQYRGNAEALITPPYKQKVHPQEHFNPSHAKLQNNNPNEQAKYLQQNDYGNQRPPRQDSSRIPHNDMRGTNLSNPPRNDHVYNRLGNTHEYNEPRNNVGVGQHDDSSSYRTSQYHQKNHPNYSKGSANSSSTKGTDLIALKSFYGSSLESYFNPPERDICGMLPENLEANQRDGNFDDDRHRNDLAGYSSLPNDAPSQYQVNNNYPTESPGYFNSSNAGSHKDIKELPLKNFYGSTLESYFNPPENDFCNQSSDQSELIHRRNDFDDDQDIDFYGDSGTGQYQKDDYTAEPAEPAGFCISSLDDLLRNPPDNLDANDDFDNADDNFYDNPEPVPCDSVNPEQEAGREMRSAAIDSYDNKYQSPPNDYDNNCHSEQKDNITDGSANRNDSSRNYPPNVDDADNYSNAVDDDGSNANYVYQSNTSHGNENNTGYGNNGSNNPGRYGNYDSRSNCNTRSGMDTYNHICQEIKQLKEKLFRM